MGEAGATDSFGTLFEFLPIGAYRSLPDGRLLRANPALVRLNGCRDAAELAAHVHDIGREWYVDPARRAQFQALLERDGHVRHFESEVHRYKTRERIWVNENAHLVRDAAGRVLYYEGTVEEITEHKQAEQALRDNGELWRRAMESTGDGLWDWDLHGGTGQVSAKGMALLGYAGTEVDDGPAAMDALTHPDDVPAMRRAREEHFSGRAPAYVNEHRLRCQDGRWKWVLSRGVVIQRDAEGRPLRMIGTYTDIDADKAADALRHERDRAAAADLAKTQFLSRVSHELRTPLNAILGFAQLLELDQGAGAPPPARPDYVAHILDSGRHLLALVNDILDLSSSQTGELRLQTERVPLRALLDEALHMLSPVAQHGGVTLRDDLAGAPLPALQVDRRRAKQVLGNLLSNAIKYNRAGGWVRLVGHDDGADFVLQVADSGLGIAPEHLARLFQPFERLGAERGPVAGTGLGLALSRQLAQAMGGDIAVQSRPGEGSVFSLRLPRAPG